MRFLTYFLSIFKKNKMRYIACILGFGMALGAVFGVSAYTSVLDETVNRFYFLEENSFMLLGRGTNLVQIIPFESEFPDNVSTELLKIPGISYTIPVIFKDFSNVTQYKWIKNVVVGINFGNLQNLYMKDVGLQSGTWASDDTHEIVVGPNLEIENLSLGVQISIRGINFTITGILNTYNVFFDKFLYLDYEIMQSAFNMEGFCSAMYIIGNQEILSNSTYVDGIEQQIEEQFPTINLIDSEELDEASGFYYKILDTFNIVLWVFPLFVSGLFIFILMLLNVKDQEQEFGMLRALGMPLWRIGTLVFFQTLVITFIGYILSLITGNFYFTYGYYIFRKDIEQNDIFAYVTEMIHKIPFSIYIQTLIISLSLGIVISIYPSIRALRMSIVQTFRKEE
ncbi:MAG: ABC transporter permease [Promethearchaeota archaeon]